MLRIERERRLNLMTGDPGNSGVAICPTLRCNLRCENCLHSGGRRTDEYTASDYLTWLRRLNELADYELIRLTGGEPFLHSDLRAFVAELKQGLGKRILVFTNGTWLAGELERFDPIVSLVDHLRFTFYPHSYTQARDDAVQELKQRYPDKDISLGNTTHFRLSMCYTQPDEVTSYCEHARCIQLLPDGRLARCGQVYGIGSNPLLTRQFIDCDDMYFDLRRATGLSSWYDKWPLEACQFCSVWKNILVDTRESKKD